MHWRSEDFSTGAKGKERSDRAGGGAGGRRLKMCVSKIAFFAHYYRGKLCVVAKTNPLPFPLLSDQRWGGGGMAP